MKKSRWIDPYQKPGKTNARHTTGKSGVYLIRNKAGDIVYIGYSSSDLYKTMYRHFQSWTDRRQIRVTYSPKGGFQVRVILCTPKQAAALERVLIAKIQPRDNPRPVPMFDLTAYDREVLQKEKAAPIMSADDFEAPF